MADKASPFISSLAHHAADPFRLLIESVKEYAIFMLDPAGCVASWNPAAERIFGYQAEEIVGSHFSCFFTPEDIASGEDHKILEHALKGHYSQETRRVRKDGSTFWTVTTVSDLRDFFGNHAGFAEVTCDITERRLAREALDQERDLSAAILDSLPGIYYMYDETRHFLRWNRKFEEVSEYSPQEIERMHPLDFFPAAEKDLLAQRVETVFRTGSAEVEATIVSKSGQCTPYYFNGVLAYANRQYCLLGMGIDISARKKSEESLQAADQWLRLAASAAMVGLWDWDLTTDKVYFSKEWKSQIGYEEHEIGCSFDEWQSRVHPDDLEGALQMMRLFIADPARKYNTEFRLQHRNGSYRWILSQGSLLFNSLNIPVRMLGSHVDVTEQRQVQKQHQQANKMEALGQLAAGVAHDFNNILTVINGCTDTVIQTLSVDDPKYGLLMDIHEAGQRAGMLTRQLMMFSRQETVEPTILNLNSVINDSEKMFVRLLGPNIVLNTHLEPDLGNIKADHSQIDQILINLVVNARDAMPNGGRIDVGGRIDITTQNVPLDESISTYNLQAGTYVMLSVSDTGCGMSEATRSRMFEPFFTTKTVGMGIGLATVDSIVRHLNGHIAVSSEIGKGTTFRLFLPEVRDIRRLI